MNNDLISREALKKAISEYACYSDYVPTSRIENIIDNAPTVEINTNEIEYKAYCKGLEDGKKIARPQGEWKPFDLTFGRSIYYCSKCKNSVDLPIENGRSLFNFCPNCGADMRGGAE